MPASMALDDFEALRRTIADKHDQLPPVLRRIAEFALAHPNEVALGTVAELAKRAAVQPSALVRFAQSLGFDGFSDLQRVFRGPLVEDRQSYRERLRRQRPDAGETEPASAEAVLHRFVDAGLQALEQLETEIDPERLERAVTLAAAASTIYVVAQRRSFPVAAYLAYALFRLDRPTVLLDGVGGMLAEQARALSGRDLLLAVSFHPYAPETLSIIHAANARGCPVVALTDRPLSPLRSLAEVAFEVQDAEVLGFRSLTATMCLAQSLVVALGRRLLAGDAATPAP